ncbi:MAG: hypothetical protein KC519_06580 [Anaerolineae bacterium]|nr:hypothetical protein [Anaerolineae bacterium]
MPTKPDYVQLESGDDAAAVRDRLTFLRGRRVLLVWPEAGTALNRKLDLVLVQREAARLSIRLAIVTHDADVERYARELNISVFETIGESERKRWKRARGSLFADRARKPDEEPSADELMPVASRVRSEALLPARTRPWVQIVTLLLIVAVIAAATYIIMPSATIRITPAQERLEVQAPIVADPNPTVTTVDVDAGLIPALIVQVPLEDTATTQTTGQREIEDSRAGGTIVFINQTDSPIDIPAGTVVATSAGTPIMFQTTDTALLAGGVGLQVEAPVEALPEYAGSAGNVDEGLINTVTGDLADRVSVRNISPTAGGEDRILRTVTQADQERLLFTLRQQMQARACDEMTNRVSATQTVLCDTVRIIEERGDLTTFSAQPGDVADELSLSMRLVVEATAIEQLNGQQIALARLSAQIPRGRILLPETLEYESSGVSIDSTGRVGFVMTAQGTVIAQIDPDVLRDRLVGRSVADAQAYLTTELDLQPDTVPEIAVTPDWLPNLPLLAARIRIILETLGP